MGDGREAASTGVQASASESSDHFVFASAVSITSSSHRGPERRKGGDETPRRTRVSPWPPRRARLPYRPARARRVRLAALKRRASGKRRAAPWTSRRVVHGPRARSSDSPACPRGRRRCPAHSSSLLDAVEKRRDVPQAVGGVEARARRPRQWAEARRGWAREAGAGAGEWREARGVAGSGGRSAYRK